MNSTLKGIIKLTRFDEYVWFVIVTTALGAAAGGRHLRLAVDRGAAGELDRRGLCLHDQRRGRRRRRRHESRQDQPQPHLVPDDLAARGLHRLVCDGLISALLYALLGAIPFIIGVISLIVGFLYSWRRVRIKSMPFIDLIIHCMMLAGFQFLPAYFAYTSTINRTFGGRSSPLPPSACTASCSTNCAIWKAI